MVEGLWIFGHGDRDDSLGVCLRYALSRFRLGASQSWVDGLTGMAFSLPLLKNEDCTAWWMEGANDIRLEFAAKALGLSIETEKIESEYSSDPYAARPRKFWTSIKEKIKAGCVVIENTWPLASVIDSWDEEIDRPERVIFDGFPLFPNPKGQFHILSKAGSIPDQKETANSAIEFGLKLQNEDFDTEFVKYGKKIEEAVKSRFKLEYFCDACKREDFSCFTRTLSRIRGQKMSLAGFASETKGFQGAFEAEMTRLGLEAQNVSSEILKLLQNPDLEKDWHDKAKIASMMPF